jgi:two-component system OmpR family response regulator
MNKDKTRIFLVDDDTVFLKALEIDFLQYSNYEIRTFISGENCLKNMHEKPQIIILDYHLDGINKDAMNGLNTLDKIKDYDENIQVIMLSSQDSIDVAVSCMHHLAYDYVVKSETAFFRIQKNIVNILDQLKMKKQVSWYMDRM